MAFANIVVGPFSPFREQEFHQSIKARGPLIELHSLKLDLGCVSVSLLS